MVFLRPAVSKSFDLRGRANGRRAGHIPERSVAFVEKMPLALKNRVNGMKQKDNKKICVDEMMGMITCLAKFDQNQAMCGKEIQGFKACSERHLQAYKAKGTTVNVEKILRPGDGRKMDGDTVRAYINTFPTSLRTTQAFNHADLKKKPQE